MTLTWKTLARVQSEGDAHVQEDSCGFYGDTAWIIDGATQLLEPLHLPAASDPQWLAQELSRALSEGAAHRRRGVDAAALDASAAERVRAALASGLDRIDAAAELLVGPEQVRFPSAAISVAQLGQGTVAIAALADCTVVVRTRDGNCHTVQAAPADAKVDAESPRESQDPARRRALLSADRAQRNTPGNLWVARREAAAAAHAHVVEIAAPEVVVMASDGAWRAVELGLVGSAEEFLERASSTRDALALLHDLRQHQGRIGEVADDATILTLRPADGE